MDDSAFNEVNYAVKKLQTDFKCYNETIGLRNSKWSQYDKQYPSLTKEKTINLNVGGFRHRISEKNLYSKSDSKFQTIVEEALKLKKESTETEEVFIDRPGDLFHHIADFLRGDEDLFKFLTTELKIKLAEEADFYGVIKITI
jgi:hypothetical protein